MEEKDPIRIRGSRALRLAVVRMYSISQIFTALGSALSGMFDICCLITGATTNLACSDDADDLYSSSGELGLCCHFRGRSVRREYLFFLWSKSRSAGGKSMWISSCETNKVITENGKAAVLVPLLDFWGHTSNRSSASDSLRSASPSR